MFFSRTSEEMSGMELKMSPLISKSVFFPLYRLPKEKGEASLHQTNEVVLGAFVLPDT